MEFDRLLNVLPAPAQPNDCADAAQWKAVEAKLGLILPTDYKAYIQVYGTGVIGNAIRVHNPFSEGQRYHFWTQYEAYADSLARLQTVFTDRSQELRSYPHHGGLLPWANTLDGDGIFWKIMTVQTPWPVVVVSIVTGETEYFPFSATEFLYRFVTRQLKSTLLPKMDKRSRFHQGRGSAG